MILKLTGFGLWLLSLALPVAVLAQQPVYGVPGLAPGMPGLNPYVPGATPGIPGLTPFVPGAVPGMPGLTPGLPGMTPGVPGYNPMSQTVPYIQPQAPGSYTQPQTVQQPYGLQNPWVYPSRPAQSFQPQQPAQVPVIKPYLEIEVDSNTAYVHQNLVMIIRVISTVNLKTATAQMQDTDDVIFRQLGDATAKTRTRRGQTEIVNTLHFQLTPLRSGRIELDEISVTGVMDVAAPTDASYDAVAPTRVSLTVSDPVPGVQPWLPLQELVLSASLSNDERVGEGEPMTLTVVQRAVGMSGAQLPSLETQLQAPGHRLYREKSDYEGTVTKQGQLVGTRTDRYTLVPQQGNEVVIPAIRVDWFNVKRHRKETSVLPSRLLNERERRSGEQGLVISGEQAGATVYWIMWLISLLTAFLLGRYWQRLAPYLRSFRHWLWQRLNTASQPALRHTAEVLARMSPQRNLHRLRRQVADNLPRSARLWFCVRSADDEQDPDDWSQVLRFLINRRLGLSAQLPMSKLAEKIIEIHPGADSDKIRALLSELEAGLFAGRPIQDFAAWKKEFKRQIRPRPFARLRFRPRYLQPAGLPSLNPTS
ncbi:MAG: BatD family protein [Thiotrichales bacterium]|nr:MAG: BatD family protein [Thiotrichales bacterium]